MRGRQLVTILVLLAIIGGFGVFLYRRAAESWKSSGTDAEKKLVNFPINDVAQVTIKGHGAEVNLVRQNDGWKVKERSDYPASFELISGLLRKTWELRPLQEIEVGPSQFARLELNPPTQETAAGVLMELKDPQGKRLAALLLGKKYLKQSDVPLSQGGFPAGRYLKSEDGSNRVVLVSDSFEEAEPKPERWLDRDFFKAENPRSIVLASPAADLNWNVGRNSATEPWTLRDAKPGEEFDAEKFASVAATVASPTFVDVLAANTPPTETGLDHPSSVMIETFDNFNYAVRVGKQIGDNFPVTLSVNAQLPIERTPAKDEKPEDKARSDQEFQTKQKQLGDKLAKEQKLANHVYLVTKATIDQLLKPRSALMAEKKSPTPAPTPAAGAAKAPPSPSAAQPKRPRKPKT